MSTLIKGWNSSTGHTEGIHSTDGAAHGTLATLIAGERNQDSATNSYLVTYTQSNGSVVDVSTNSTDVSSSAPALLLGVYINTDIAVEAVGLHDGTGGTELLTIPIGSAGEFGMAGSFIALPGIRFETAIFVESTNATGSITVMWRPI